MLQWPSVEGDPPGAAPSPDRDEPDGSADGTRSQRAQASNHDGSENRVPAGRGVVGAEHDGVARRGHLDGAADHGARRAEVVAHALQAGASQTDAGPVAAGVEGVAYVSVTLDQQGRAALDRFERDASEEESGFD